MGGVRKSISLLPAFTSTSGQVVMGEQSINVLPGKAPENPEPAPRATSRRCRPRTARRTASLVRRGIAECSSPRDSWQQMHTYEPSANNQTQLRSTTIRLPMSTTQRLVQQASIASSVRGGGVEQRLDACGDGERNAGAGRVHYGVGDGFAADGPTRNSFRTSAIPGSKSTNRPTKSRSCCDAPRPAGPQLAPPYPPSPNPRPSAEGSVPADSAPAGWDR